MISEIFDLLSSIDTRQSGNKRGLKLNLNKNRIRSISAYSSNSIFYFSTIVSDDTTPEEVAMISKMIERSYASFVVACISLMPFHRISADDKASVEDYLNQFHQNIGMNQGSGPIMNRFVSEINMSENASEGLQELQDFLYETWNKAKSTNSDFVKLVNETISLNDMFNEDAIDSKTRVLQEQYLAVMDEMNLWGFIGEATDTMLDSDDEDLLNMSDEEIYQKILMDPTFSHDVEDELAEEDTSVLDSDLSEASGSVKSAIDTIKFSLESVSSNKILSCQSLTKLASLEAKLNKLKTKYTKYLNRYKRQYKENEKNHTHKKLSIRFNKMIISDPKAFMQQYGTYIKLINKRLKLVEKRRAELRNRKGLEDKENKKLTESVDLTDMDFAAIDYCDKMITESLEAPDSEVFSLTEVTDAEYDELNKRHERLKSTVGHVATNARNQSKRNAALKKENDFIRKSYRDMKDQRNAAQNRVNKLEKSKTSMENKISKLEKENTKLKNANNTEKTSSSDQNQEDIYYGRPKSGIIPSRMKTDKIKVFDREVFTDMDMRKANEALPIFAKATIGFIVDDTEEVVSRDILVGIKAYIHRYNSRDMINDVYSGVINNRKFLKFVKFITGEERSLSDLIFGIKELKVDAIDSRSQASAWKTAFKRRKRWAKISIPYLMKEYTPNGTLVMTMNQVNFIKDEYGLDIMDPNNVKIVMDTNYLLGFVIIDQAEEMVYVTYDGHGYGFQQYTYAMLERENQTSDRALRELYRSLSR